MIFKNTKLCQLAISDIEEYLHNCFPRVIITHRRHHLLTGNTKNKRLNQQTKHANSDVYGLKTT